MGVMRRMGVVVHLKEKYSFMQGNKISKIPVYPLMLKDLKIVNYEFVGVL